MQGENPKLEYRSLCKYCLKQHRPKNEGDNYLYIDLNKLRKKHHALRGKII